MKLLYILLLATGLQAFEYGLKPVKVSEEIYCFFGKAEVMNKINNGNMVNSCFIDMKGSWLVVDSGPSFNYAKEATSLIQAIKDQKVSYVVNTHVHDDHWLGNNFYKKLGATIIGSHVFSTEVDPHEKTRMQAAISKEAFKNTVVTLPNKLIKSEQTITINKKDVQLLHLEGEGHSKGDIVVYIPSYKAAFAGDLIFNSRVLSLRDGNINNWIAILKRLEDLNLDYLLGGHGALSDRDSLLLTKKYLVMLKKSVLLALENDDGIDVAVETIKFKSYEKMPFYHDVHKKNISKAYQVLEWDSE